MSIRITPIIVIVGALFSSNIGFANPTVEELLTAADNMARGDQSVVQAEMHVKTARYERKTAMKIWAKGSEKTLIKITSPAKSAGMATLKVDQNIWNYMPRSGRTMKIPAGMMGGNWMGSHLSNDDLVRDSRMSEDFTATLDATPETDSGGNYVITAIPKPDAPVVWGKVIARISAEKLPVSFEYYDENGTLIRTMAFEQVTDFSGVRMPAVMRMTVSNKPGEFTQFTYLEVDYAQQVPDSTFSVQKLRSRR